ncbi:bacterio-opsin activator domain-containing protein [Halomicroarcula sp. GCM10025817]|uniref:bacterio-opsin activator domain-containing protein n=1 Tax=Halomicroarcula sp. GCM10025817 TaxID=3252672 RepID=UPI00361822BC
MGSGARVLVCGDDEAQVSRAAAALERVGAGFDVRTAGNSAPPAGLEDVDCVVSTQVDLPAFVSDLRSARPDLPVVIFGHDDAAIVRQVLRDRDLEYVQRGPSEQYVVLADRIERAVEDEAADDGTFDRHAEVIGALDDGVYALDDEGQFVFVNGAMTELTGYTEAELLGEHTRIIKDRTTVELAEDKLRELLSGDGRDDVGTTFELTIHRKDGEKVPCEDHMTVLYGDDDEFRGTAGVIRDITERKRREEMLSGLQETSRALMQAPSREEVAAIVSGAAQRTLGLDLNVVRLYDAEAQVLRPAATTAATDERLGERPVYALDEGYPGEVFATGEPVFYSDADGLDMGGDEPIRSAMFFPIGVHGTLSVLSTDLDAFDDIDRQVASLLVTNAAAACNRAKREQEVRETRERIATILERINGLIENTVEVLVEATTREAVESGVCDELVATDPYVFAWVGRPDVRDERLEATAWAGDVDVDVETVTLADDTVGARALAEDDPEIHTALEDSETEWVRQAHAAGVESVMAIPLSYTDSTYGVLFVCADQADAFDDREQVVLEALGRAVANAINAIESGKILSANKVVELEFTVDDRRLLLSRLSASTGATLTSEGTVINDDGSLRLYLTSTGADSDEVLAALEDDDSVAKVRRVAEHEGETLFDVTVTGSLLARLVDHGAVPRAVGGENGVARYTVELPYQADAREVFSIVEDNYDGVDLASYHEHERPVRTQQEFRAALAEQFTDRQETALRTAYLGGFFAWPREVDGDELASAMDISRPTYHQHLRAAQQKVFRELFEN